MAVHKTCMMRSGDREQAWRRIRVVTFYTCRARDERGERPGPSQLRLSIIIHCEPEYPCMILRPLQVHRSESLSSPGVCRSCEVQQRRRREAEEEEEEERGRLAAPRLLTDQQIREALLLKSPTPKMLDQAGELPKHTAALSRCTRVMMSQQVFPGGCGHRSNLFQT